VIGNDADRDHLEEGATPAKDETFQTKPAPVDLIAHLETL
jgi:hypothetical protein